MLNAFNVSTFTFTEIKTMRPTVQQAAAVAAVMSSVALAQSAQAAEYANVVSSTPVTVSMPVSRQVCSEGQQLVQTRPSGAGALIGAVAGGLIGHGVGGGFGRAAATGVGAVAGAVVGDQVEANSTPATAVPVRRCQMATTYENRVVGYDVMYDYAGQRYSTRMARDPGKQMAVNVQPADSGSGSMPAPAYGDPGTADASQQVGQPVPQTTYQAAPAAYYEPAPVYYSSPYPYYAPYYSPYYVGPAIGLGIGLGLGFGYHGGYHRHWR
jgi:uncharacterized protein YcfJ